MYFIQSTSLLHRYSEWHDLAKTGRTSARLLVVWPEDSMSQLLGCLKRLQTGALSMVYVALIDFSNAKIVNSNTPQSYVTSKFHIFFVSEGKFRFYFKA